MKAIRVFVTILLLSVLAAPYALAQEKPSTSGKGTLTSLKLQVTIVEREGDKKVANLPYTFFVVADYPGPSSPWAKLRTGSRVPVYAGRDYGMQYIDIGTSIDARAIAGEDGRFDLSLNLERSWVAGEVEIPLEKATIASGDANAARFKQPIVRQFKSELTLPMRDGQTIEITQAADPTTARVLTVTVTMNVQK